MRVTNLMRERNFLYNIGLSQSRLQKLQDQAASGKKINKPQDDPVGAEMSMALRHHLEQNDQHLRNLDKAKNWMESVEQALSEVTSALHRASELAIYGASDTTPPDARKALAKEVEQLMGLVQDVTDRTMNGRKLLTGTMPEWKVASDVSITVSDQSTLLSQISNTLDSLRTALDTSSNNDIESALGQMDQLMDKVLAERATNGARMKRLEILEEQGNNLDLEYQKLLSKTEDADFAEVVMHLKTAEAAYQAALAAGARLIQPSLLDYLK